MVLFAIDRFELQEVAVVAKVLRVLAPKEPGDAKF